MGNKYSKEDEIKLKSKAYKFISINELIIDVKRNKTEKKYIDVENIINQYPICVNVKHYKTIEGYDYYGVKSYYIFPTLKINEICNISYIKIKKGKFEDIKIGLSKLQYDFLKS